MRACFNDDLLVKVRAYNPRDLEMKREPEASAEALQVLSPFLSRLFCVFAFACRHDGCVCSLVQMHVRGFLSSFIGVRLGYVG